MEDRERGWRVWNKDGGQGAGMEGMEQGMEDRERGWRTGSKDRGQGVRKEGRE